MTDHGRFLSPSKMPLPLIFDRPPPCSKNPELFDPLTERENRQNGMVRQRVPPPNDRQLKAIGLCQHVCPARSKCLDEALKALAENPTNDIGLILGGTTGPQRREMVQVTRYRRAISLKKAAAGQQLNGYTMDPRRCVNNHPETSIYRIPSGRKRCRDCTKEQYARYVERNPKRRKVPA